jgi:hypothetical protein
MNIKKLSSLFDRDVRIKCGDFKKKIDDCLADQFCDEFQCEAYIMDFNLCVNKFNEEFRKKHNFSAYEKKTSN